MVVTNHSSRSSFNVLFRKKFAVSSSVRICLRYTYRLDEEVPFLGRRLKLHFTRSVYCIYFDLMLAL